MRRSKHIQAFESSVEKLSRILSNKWDIKVVFGSKVPITTGKVIYLPTIPNDASKDFLTVVQGHLDHETAHVLFTDFEVLKTIDLNDKKLYLLVNGLEDSRIEKEYCDVWQGAHYNLKKSLEWALIKMVERQNGTNRWDELRSISRLIYLTTVLPQLDFDEMHWFVRDFVDRDSLLRVRHVVPLIKEAIEKNGDTAKVIGIARKIMDIWMKDEPKTPNPPQKPPQQQTATQPSPGTVLKPASSDWEPPQAPSPPSPTEPDVQKYEELTSKAQLIKEEVEKCVKQNPPKYAVYTTAGDKVEKVKDGNRSDYKSFLNLTNHMVPVIKKKMTRSLLSTAVNSWETGKPRGRLDSRAAYKVALGTSSNVFKERVVAVGHDTAVMLMIDHSGSMHGEPLLLASQASIILGEVLNSIGIPFSVAGFSTGGSNTATDRKAKASQTDMDIYTRWGDLWIGVYKDFDENWTSVNHRLIRMVENGHNTTYDGESLRWGAKQLLSRPEKRKIMFWLNDGEPSPLPGDNMPAHIAYAVESAKDVESVVELIAVGIYSSSVSRYYKNCIVVRKLDELPKLCVNELDALLRRTKGDRNGRK